MSLSIPDSERTQASTPEQERVSALRSAPDLFPDGYEKYEIVGQGGMGIVYRARDIALDRDIAIKLLQPHFAADSTEAKRFVEEARITAQLQHPGIPAIHEVGTMANDRPFIAMKLIKGETLDSLLKRPDARPANFIATFEAIAFALGYAHSRHVIHRDLKPANIMVGAFGEVQVMDWGLAKVLASNGCQPTDSSVRASTSTETYIRSARDADSGSETRHGDFMGTPAYMPPEQAIGAVDKIDRRSDVFGIGAIFCTILTGKPPFADATAESTRQLAAQAKLSDAFARLDSCGAEPEWIALAKRCLSAEPGDRPANGIEVANEVANLRAAADERAKQAEIGKASSDTRRRVLTWAAAVVFAVLSAGVSVSWLQAKRASEAESTANAKTMEVEATLEVVGERTKLAMNAFNDMVFGIQTKLENRPGTQDLRKELLEQARVGLRTILDEARKRGTPDRTLVWSHFRMGDVERQLGNTLAAEKEFRAGHEISQRLAYAAPTNAETQRDLSVGYIKIGDIVQQLGQTHDSLDFYRKALEIRQRLADADPTNDQTQRDLSVSYDNLGDATLKLGQTEAALHFYLKAKEARLRLADADTKNAQAQRDLSLSYLKLGDVTLQRDQTESALDYYRKAWEVHRRLADADRQNAQEQRGLSVSHWKMATAFQKQHDFARAAHEFEKAETLAQGFS